ncbi:MAG: chemotaxis protein CheW [Pseudomonadales bacterium]|nr:chemotaxis protein CheW [Pseudomonadales bacterium]
MDFTQTGASAGEELQRISSQYLTFMLDGEEYGIDILKVQGIQSYGKVTPLPQTPDFVLGVVNLRGAIVPIVDLRLRFDMKQVPVTQNSVVIVVKVQELNKERTVGLLVDAVSEVRDVGDHERQAAPEFGTSVNSDYIEGLATVEERMLILLDIDHLINSGVMEQVESAQDRALQ